MYKDIMTGFDVFFVDVTIDYQGNNLVYFILFTLVNEVVKIK
jgi:hypothetical protein